VLGPRICAESGGDGDIYPWSRKQVLFGEFSGDWGLRYIWEEEKGDPVE